MTLLKFSVTVDLATTLSEEEVIRLTNALSSGVGVITRDIVSLETKSFTTAEKEGYLASRIDVTSYPVRRAGFLSMFWNRCKSEAYKSKALRGESF